jgi:hypothetical protein
MDNASRFYTTKNNVTELIQKIEKKMKNQIMGRIKITE